MTLTLEIPPETEAILQEKARRRGLSLDAYLLDLAARDESTEDQFTEEQAAPDPFFTELDAIARRFPTEAPPLADDAVGRVYADREVALL